jgi:hypothetical protein
MRRFFKNSVFGCIAVATLLLPQACTNTNAPAKITTKADSLSYSYGVMMALDISS